MVDASRLSNVRHTYVDIHITHKDVNYQLMINCLSQEVLAQIWSGGMDNNVPKESPIA